jgi:hypothetical protein
MRVRIYSHVTQSRFLHIEDALQIGKLRLFVGSHRPGQGMPERGFVNAFVDMADARVIFDALARGEPEYSYKEYKGTPHPEGAGAESRVLAVAVKGEQVYVELKRGPGKVTPTGAITPNGRAEVEVNVTFKRHEARRMGAAVMAYLQAWEVLRMLGQQRVVGQPAPYLLVAAGREAARNGEANGRPVTRKDVVKADGAAAKSAKGKLTGQRPFQYGDGTLVDGENLTEVQTFQRYQAEKQAAPTSKVALLDYYRQRMQAVGG